MTYSGVTVSLVFVVASLANGPVSAAEADTATKATPAPSLGVQNSTASPPPVLGNTSARLREPLTVSGVLNFPIINPGIDVSYHLTDRFAIGGQVTSMLLIHTELTLRTRFFFLVAETMGVYIGCNALLLHSPWLYSVPAAGAMAQVPVLGATAELGFEARHGSWVFGFGAGAGVVWAQVAGRHGATVDNWQRYPVVNLRIGRSRRP